MKRILLSMFFCAASMHAFSQVTTFAGSGIAGYADGPASAAQFNYPNGIVIDKAGNFYVADWSNCIIRRITPSGIVSTFAGSTRGYMDGLASVAQFNDPWGLAIDTADNIYVADAKNNRIRKITPAGMVSTLAGSGSAMFADGFGTAASFSYPATVATDKNGNIYVGDGGNNRVRKITPAGLVTTIAGDGTGGLMDGPAATAQFRVPTCLVITASGDIFVSDRDNNAIRKISGGMVTTFAGGTYGYADGKGTAAQFNNPHGILLDDDGSLFIADTRNNRIRKIDTGANVTTISGSVYGFNDGTFATALFSMPKCLAKDKKGNLYVTDEQNNRVRKLSGVAVTGITEYTTNPALAYPNPAGQIITLRCAVDDVNTQIVFYDMKGEVVLNTSVATPSLQLNESVSIAGLLQGTYYVQIISGTSVSNTRISKF